MPDRTPGRRPLGSGVDGNYVETRKPTVDDTDDIYDDDGVLEEELEEETDLTLNVTDPPRSPPRDTNLKRRDKGAVNLDEEDLES